MTAIERDLKLLCDKAVLQPFSAPLITLCPTLDLTAIVVAENTVEVFRHDGQRAFRYKRQNDERISAMCWREDGMYALQRPN